MFAHLKCFAISILEEGTATHSSIPAWRIPWTEETGGLPSQRVGHDWDDLAQHAPCFRALDSRVRTPEPSSGQKQDEPVDHWRHHWFPQSQRGQVSTLAASQAHTQCCAHPKLQPWDTYISCTLRLSEPRNHQEDRRGEFLPGSVQGSVLGSLQSWPVLGLRGSFRAPRPKGVRSWLETQPLLRREPWHQLNRTTHRLEQGVISETWRGPQTYWVLGQGLALVPASLLRLGMASLSWGALSLPNVTRR